MNGKMLFIICTGLVILGCNNSTGDNIVIKDLNNGNKNQPIFISNTLKADSLITIGIDKLEEKVLKYSDVFNSIKFIPLETTQESLIGQIRHIELIDDTIYILDFLSSKSLFLFSKSGKFIRRIGEVGKGPGENQSPSDFTVDEKNKEIYILDSYLQKINIYSTSGIYKRQIKYKTDVRSNYIEYKDGQLFLDARMLKNAELCYLLREIDGNGNELNRWFKVPEYNKGWNVPYYLGGSGTLYSAPSDIKYSELFMDTIFSVTPLGIKPFIVVQTKNYLTPKHLSEIQGKNGDEVHNSIGLSLAKENLVWSLHNYVENNDIIFFKYRVKHYLKSILINKKSGKQILWRGSIDDLTFKDYDVPEGVPSMFSGNGKTIIGKIPDITVFQTKIRTQLNSLSDSEKNSILNLTITSNPILFIIESK